MDFLNDAYQNVVYVYICNNCDLQTTQQQYVAEVECVCSIGTRTYRGYNQNGGFWEYFSDENFHYFYNPNDQKYYYLDNQEWYERGTYPQQQEQQQELDEEPEQQINPVIEALEVADFFPDTDEAAENCSRSLQEIGLQEEKRKNMAIQMLQSDVVGGDRQGAWATLARWNKLYPKSRIGISEVSLRPEDNPALAQPIQIQIIPVMHQPIQVTYNGLQHQAALFSNVGGHHIIYEPTGFQQMVHGISNDKILIRMPKEGAPTPLDGYRMGKGWEKQGFILPVVYNIATLAQDNFYIVEKVPHAFERTNINHVTKVSRMLTVMSELSRGPDFRPDNVRFRDNGEMILIDFSENPGVEQTESFYEAMKNFVDQFAQGNPQVFAQLTRDMDGNFLRKMNEAVQDWYK